MLLWQSLELKNLNKLITKIKIMEILKFKTNINCSGCVAKVTPHLNSAVGIKEWNVDTNNPGKLLTVETENLNDEQVKNIVERAGFKAETIG